MDLATDVIREIISDRSSFGSQPADDPEHRARCLDAAVKEAEIFLANGLGIAIHILLGHDQCKYKQPSNCKACCEVEVWTVQVSASLGQENSTKPLMIPGFLTQAIRSQLHFSPTKSWFTTSADAEDGMNVAQNYKCVYRVSTSSYFQNEENEKKIDQHKFPSCKLDDKLISIDVKSLKKENFPTRPTKCPSRRNDAELWVFPEADLIGSKHGKKIVSCRNSKDIPPPAEEWKSGREKRETNIIVEIPEAIYQHKPRVVDGFNGVLVDKTNVSLPKRRQIDETPIKSHPIILSMCKLDSKKLYRGVERASSPYTRNRAPNRTPRRLLCNFEESVLKGCLRPIRIVNGFKLQLAITASSLATKHITIPTTTSYFSEELSPSLYMSDCLIPKAISNSKQRPGIQIPRQCVLQAVLFNTQGSVVKIFLVNVNVSDMPPLSQTFIRQRTQTVKQIVTGTSEIGNGKLSANALGPNHDTIYTGTSSTSSQLSNSTKRDSRTGNAAYNNTALQFLIHVRLLSDHRGRIWLHSDIKMLLSNRGGDLDGLISTRTESNTLMPQCPKYSPIK